MYAAAWSWQFCHVVASMDGSTAANYSVKNRETVRVDGRMTRPRSASPIASRQDSHASFGDPRVIPGRWVRFGRAKLVIPLRTALAYKPFHDATKSRSPAVTT